MVIISYLCQDLPDSLSEDSTTVYGVVLHTEEGSDYGMRHLENIWRKTNIAWASGFTETVYGRPLAPDHYKSMMGKHLYGVLLIIPTKV